MFCLAEYAIRPHFTTLYHCLQLYTGHIHPIIFFILLFPDQEYWYEQARIALRKRLQYATDLRPHAKNVLFFVGDGMGVATATAARILRGQRMGKKGEDHDLAWDTFPAVAFAKVCSEIKVSSILFYTRR